ncbi:ASPARTYL PROTEASE AED1 [Salix viminalis]|uniref:ASPARTYL PROTEASE AED1 n=1 Tax=Salix viminalis TaxID=40686 RepID=A0A9Q0SDM2_SALVM|nr:ASPARTYL PROTEASE AED1 [Salix viminalis]
MATPTSPAFLLLLLLHVFLFLLCSSKKGHTVSANRTTKNHFHNVHANSLLPSSVCDQSNKVFNRASSLKVVSKYGPCSVTGDPKTFPSAAEIVLQDELRVKSLRTRLSMNSSTTGVLDEKKTTIPSTRYGGYTVAVGLGTPKKDFSLIFDTGSDLTWTQCEPCLGGCFPQKEEKFDPTKSTSYKNLSCLSEPCKSIAKESVQRCSSGTCLYGVQYGSGFTVGFLATETLTITPSDVFENFVIGCGEKNDGKFSGEAGLLGLGRSSIALPSQTSSKYKNLFSYCLPASLSSAGHLSFGGEVSNAAKFTPITTKFKEFYGLDVAGISVEGRKLAIDASLFKTAGTIIDSGTTLTYLPSTAYSALSSAFQEQMTNYTLTNGTSGFQPCYDFSKHANDPIAIPQISIFFEGGVEVDIDVSGIMLAVNGLKEVCLAFRDNRNDKDISIFGNLQQKTYEVVYDVAKGMVGFARGGC